MWAEDRNRFGCLAFRGLFVDSCRVQHRIPVTVHRRAPEGPSVCGSFVGRVGSVSDGVVLTATASTHARIHAWRTFSPSRTTRCTNQHQLQRCVSHAKGVEACF
jgi:hypothetical protein